MFELWTPGLNLDNNVCHRVPDKALCLLGRRASGTAETRINHHTRSPQADCTLIESLIRRFQYTVRTRGAHSIVPTVVNVGIDRSDFTNAASANAILGVEPSRDRIQ